MFTRFRETAGRLQISLVETRRADGRVRHQHVAGFGSVRIPASPANRVVFWTKLHQRIAALGNRVDAAAQGAILAAVHARLPMPTQDDHRAALLEAAQADARFWNTISEIQADQLEGMKASAAAMTEAAANAAPDVARSAANAKQAADRLARVERGEDASGIGKPLSQREVLRILGWKAADVRHAERLADIDESAMPEVMAEIQRRSRATEKAAVRKVLRRRLQR